MAMATQVTVVEVEEDILPVGAIDPDDVHTRGIFVHRASRRFLRANPQRAH
jgi:acyl CoA:acetate/3-ketoacid CoA transferase alpha subunit